MERAIDVAAADVPSGTGAWWVARAHGNLLARLRFVRGQLRCGRFRPLDTWLRRLRADQASDLVAWIESVRREAATHHEPGRIYSWSGRRHDAAAIGTLRLWTFFADLWTVGWAPATDGPEATSWADARDAASRSSVAILAGGLAHDWNNQLSIISGFCHLLLAQMGEEDPRREMVEAIREAGARMAQMSRQLQVLSDLHPQDHRQVTDAAVAWLEWLEGFFEGWLQRGGDARSLSVELPREKSADDCCIATDVRAQADLLRYVLEEALRAKAGSRPLVFRAVRATSVDERWLEERSLPKGMLLGWELVDPERVLTDAERQRIFEPYASYATSHASGPQGPATASGRSRLGLAAAARLAVSLEGNLACRSEQGTGTVFRFAFRPLP